MYKAKILVRPSVFLCISLLGPIPLSGQNWSERLPFSHTYDLSNVRILTIAADDFNYEETIETSNLWRTFGAAVDYAGPEKTLTGELPEFLPPAGTADKRPSLAVDVLLSTVDVSAYDIIYLAGGEGITVLLKEHRAELQRLVDESVRQGKLVGAMCHAPLALSASGSIKGRRVTANGREERRVLTSAGAIVTDDVCVCDGPFLTGQWPFLQTFALTVAERKQFPDGGGPLERFMARRSSMEKLLDDIRSTPALAPFPVGADTLEIILRSALKTPPLEMTMKPSAPFRLIALTSKEAKTSVGMKVFEQSKNYFVSRGAPELAIREMILARFATPPVLYVAVVDPSMADTVGHRTMIDALQNCAVHYGSSRENIILSARSMGLGIALLGYPRFLAAGQEIGKVLNLPSSARILDMFAIGYPIMHGLPPLSRPSTDIIFLERWGVTKEKH